jgi:hypothetical protein
MISDMRTLGHQSRHNYEHPVLDSVVAEDALEAEEQLAVEMWRRSVGAGHRVGDPDLVELRQRRNPPPPGGAPCSRVYRVEGPVLDS